MQKSIYNLGVGSKIVITFLHFFISLQDLCINYITKITPFKRKSGFGTGTFVKNIASDIKTDT